MSNFPLYDKLNKDIQTKELTAKQKTDFITKIEKMDQNGFNIIYILIKIYAIKENNQNITPYTENFTENKNLYDMTWDLKDIPQKLKQILYKFICMHYDQMKEEKDREQLRL